MAKTKSEIKQDNIKYRKRKALVKRTLSKVRRKKRRTPKFSRAVIGLTKMFLPEGAEGFQYSKSNNVSGRSRVKYGRGRPKGTYKQRYVPGVGVVEVPTYIYNKMMAEARAKRRLAEAKRQALYQQQMEAEQIAMTQDPRFQQSSEDAWADSEDLEHESNVAHIQQQQYIQQQMALQAEQQGQPGLAQRGVRGVIERAKLSLMGSEQERFQRQGIQQPQIMQEPSYGRPQIDPNLHRPREPQVSLLGGKANLFSSKNLINQRNELL